MDFGGELAPPLGDVRVRQALNHAIDRATIAEGLAGAREKPTSQLVTADGFDDAYQDHYPYDPAQANALLADAGYPDGFTFTVVAGSHLGIHGTPSVQAVAKYLSEIGVELEINSVSGAEFVEQAYNGQNSALMVGNQSTVMSLNYSTLFAPDAPTNIFHAMDPVLEGLFVEAAVASDPAPIWKAMSRRLSEPALTAPVFMSELVWYASPDIDGVELSRQAAFPNPLSWI